MAKSKSRRKLGRRPKIPIVYLEMVTIPSTGEYGIVLGSALVNTAYFVGDGYKTLREYDAVIATIRKAMVNQFSPDVVKLTEMSRFMRGILDGS